MSFDDFPLIPDTETEITPDEDAAAAEASLLDAASPAAQPAGAPEPFGRTGLFDFERGRFVRAGGAPVWVTGLRAVEQWVLMAVHAARYAHPLIFSEEFGMEDPEAPIGEAADVDEAISDWGERLAEAVVGVHERITSVEDFEYEYDAASGIIYVTFTVVTDEEELTIENLAVSAGSEDQGG